MVRRGGPTAAIGLSLRRELSVGTGIAQETIRRRFDVYWLGRRSCCRCNLAGCSGLSTFPSERSALPNPNPQAYNVKVTARCLAEGLDGASGTLRGWLDVCRLAGHRGDGDRRRCHCRMGDPRAPDASLAVSGTAPLGTGLGDGVEKAPETISGALKTCRGHSLAIRR